MDIVSVRFTLVKESRNILNIVVLDENELTTIVIWTRTFPTRNEIDIFILL